MANNVKDVSFGFNKYKEPDLKSLKESVANSIVNACFMVPGNLPGLPTVGVNIKQYFYKEESELSADKITADVQYACGKLISGASIIAVDFSVQKTTYGDYIFLLIIKVNFPEDGDQLLGVMMTQQDNRVKFNFEYMDL